MSIEALNLDLDPKTYVARHELLDEVVVDAALTDREFELRKEARDLVAREIAPRAARLDDTHEFASHGVEALSAAGLGGLVFPTRLGGSDDTNVAYAVVMEEVTAGCAATSLVFMTQMHAAYPILRSGSEQLQQRYIPGLIDATSYGAIGITEPDAGSDVASLKTTATRAGDDWILKGQKTFITNGDRADVIVCFASIDRSKGRDGITAFVVEGGWDGVEHGRPFVKMGMHGSGTAEVFFDNVRVPDTHVLGEPGRGWPVAMRSVVKTRISAAAQGVGLARAAYARTLAALTRLHGHRLPDDLVFALAEIRGRILQGRLLLHAVAREADRDPDIPPGQIGMMKQVCTDLGFQTAMEAVRLLGPYGDLGVFGVERCLRDAKVTQIYDGTNEIQRLLIGRETTRALKDLA